MKWIKIRDVISEIAGRDVALLLTTQLPHNYRSAVDFNSTEVTLMLNARYAKSWNDIVDSIVHELVHIKNNNSSHGEKYNDWERQLAVIKIEFLKRMDENEKEGNTNAFGS